MGAERELQIGDRVSITDAALSLPWVGASRIKGLLRLKEGMVGTVVRFTNDRNKIGVQFDEKIWFGESPFNNGCHGKGKIGHCVYIPETIFGNRTTLPVAGLVLAEDNADEMLLLLC